MKREEQINEVRTVIVSLLISYQHNLSLAALDNAYFKLENERIPWRKLGYESLCAFLKSMPDDFEVYLMNGTNYVRGLESEKSSHVKSLVSRQKNNSRPRQFSSYASSSSSHNYGRTTIPFNTLSTLVQYIESFPKGINMQDALQFIRTEYPNIRLSVHDLRSQLREVSHQVYLDNNMIYPQHDTSQKNDHQQPRSKPNLQANSHTVPNVETIFVAAGLSDEEDVNNTGNLANNYVNGNQSRSPSEEFVADHRNQMLNGVMNDHDVNYIAAAQRGFPYSERVNVLINDKIKLRLSELIQKYPDGIICAELPDKYLKEYNVHLNYAELGFASVREFVYYLPQIFYVKNLNVDGDVLLLSADKRPTVPELESFDKKNIEKERKLRTQEEEYDKAKSPPVPTDIPANIANRAFVPDDAMKYHESVKLIPVTELKEGKFLEVYISEVFNPSFFWIHLRQYRDQLVQLMEDINEFYNRNYTKYVVPNVGLIKGLYCACVYDDRWHRGVIKSVKPDFQVTILFIDYGTVKTYPSDNICYLYRKFTRLPVQAIPCGLFNIRPYVGDRWSSNANKYFCDKVSGHLLAATVHSIDTAHNSLMVILTDTSEEEEVHINDWLVSRNLARLAETVRMCYFLFFYKDCNVCNRSGGHKVVKKSDAEKTLDKTQNIKKRAQTSDRLYVRDSKNRENKNVKASRNIPFSGEKLLLKLKNFNSSDSKSQLKTNSQTKPSKLLEKLAAFSEKQKSTSAKFSSNSSVCTSKTNESFASDTQESNVRTGINSNLISRCQTKDFDDGMLDKKSVFGEFSSLYGGRGHRMPCDWSANFRDDYPRRTACSSNSKLVTKLKLMNIEDNKSDSQRNVKPIRPCPYFQQLAERENEGKYIWTPEMNVKNTVNNMSQTIASLKQRVEIPTDEYIAVTVPDNVLKLMHDSNQSQDTLNSTTSSVEISSASSCDILNSAAKSVEINDVSSCEKLTKKCSVNRNGEICETKSSQKIEEDENSNAETLDSSKCDTDCSEFDTTNEPVNMKYKKLLDHLMENMQKNSTYSNSTTKSLSSGQSRTSSRISSSNSSINSNNSNSNYYTTISIHNEDYEMLYQKNREKISDELNTSSSISNLDNESEMIKLLSSDSFTSLTCDNSDQDQSNQFCEAISTTFSNNDSKQHLTNYDEILENCTTVSSVDDSEQQSNHSSEGDSKLCRTNNVLENNSTVSTTVCELKPQPNATAETSLFLKFQQMLKITQSLVTKNNGSDLDSDDLSDSDNNNEVNDVNKKDAKSDKSCDTFHNMSDETSVIKDDEHCDEESIKNDESVQVIRNDEKCNNKSESMNESKCSLVAYTPPSNNQTSDEALLFNDCDLEFDSECETNDDRWDVCGTFMGRLVSQNQIFFSFE